MHNVNRVAYYSITTQKRPNGSATKRPIREAQKHNGTISISIFLASSMRLFSVAPGSKFSNSKMAAMLPIMFAQFQIAIFARSLPSE
jgi:hypothetical protein